MRSVARSSLWGLPSLTLTIKLQFMANVMLEIENSVNYISFKKIFCQIFALDSVHGFPGINKGEARAPSRLFDE